jgi:uroporphyrinogen-III decarboxylase
MSLADGLAALRLEMPKRIPRTEYSLEMHPGVVRAVTGIELEGADDATRHHAQRELYDAWNYDLIWCTLPTTDFFRGFHTRMGHAEYQSGGTDYDPVVGSPFRSADEVLAFDPWKVLGERDTKEMIAAFDNQYQANCNGFPNQVSMTGVYATCISGVLELFGWNWLLEALGTDPQGFGEVVNRYSSWVQQYFDALAASEATVVMVHDDMVWTSGPFTRPSWYRAFVFPALKRQLAPLRESGKTILFTADGDYTAFIDDIADCEVSGFVMEPMTDMARIARDYGKTHAIIGNADTRILLSGSKQEIRAEVERCICIGKNCPGFFMAVGNHIPPNTPLESVLYYNKVYEELSRR